MSQKPIEATYSRVDDDPFEEGCVYQIHVHDVNDSFYVTFAAEATEALMHYVIYAYMVGRNHGASMLACDMDAAIKTAIQNVLEEAPNTEGIGSYSVNGKLNK